MLFVALLLIQWLSLTIGAAAPLLPSKEIHLQIPIGSHFARKDSGISRLIFWDSKEISAEGFKDLAKIPFIRKEISDSLSSVKPTTGNVDTKPRSPREIMNSSMVLPSFLGGKLIPTPGNMNTPSPYNGKDMDKMTSLPHPGDLVDMYKGKWEENGTLFNLEHHEERADLVINDTFSNTFTPNPDSSFNHERNRNRKTLFEDAVVMHKQMAQSNNSSSNLTSNANEKTFIPDFLFSTVASSEKKTEVRRFKNFDQSDLKATDTGQNVANAGDEIKLKSDKNHSYSINSTYILKMTLKPKVKFRDNRKQKGGSNSTNFEISLFSKTIHKTLNGSNLNPMLQDGPYQIVTSATTLYAENSWLRSDIESMQNGGHLNKGSTSSITLSLSLTTPDSHMNDPPFRGPNIPPEIDHFYKEKEKTKMDYHNPAVVETPTFKVKNLGDDWKPDRQILGIAWDCHYYIMGSFFAVIALYSFISLLRVNTFVTLLNTGYYIAVNAFILLLSILRTLYLFYDPYNLSRKYPILAASILPKITLPCLTSSFSLLLLSFLNSTKTQFLTPKFQRPCTLALVITLVFLTFFSLEIAVCFLHAPSMLLVGEYLLFVVWAKLSSVSYFCVFKRLHHRALRKQGEMIRLTFTKMHIDGAQLPKKLPKPTLGLSVKLVLISAILQTTLCVLTPFGMVLFQAVLPSVLLKDPWIWWGYQLTCRILELLIAATMSFIATQPQTHFESGENRFCSILMWFPCSSFAECFKKEEIVDFEAHSDNYANPQGLRNTGQNLSANSRRLQTNSLPTFRTPLTDVDKNLPMRTLPCSGRHNNHASAISLLSYYRSKRTLSVSTNDVLGDLERTLCNQTTSSSDGRNNTLRPASMLYKDNGFIRFRQENDPEQPMEMSDEDERIQEDVDTSLEDAESTKANVGSSFHSILDGDTVQNTLSPFFQIGYKRRFRKMSRVSIETTDYSADVSSDQLSNVVNLRSGLSTSALDFNTRKYGSTCSSESAANSFDVTFFLNSNSSPEMQTSPTSTTPASLNVCSAYRSETEDDKTSSVEGHEVMLRSVSPIVKRASSGRLSLNLNLHAAADTNHSSGHVNVACGTEDITPDSAVYLDLHLSRENSISPNLPSKIFPTNLDVPQRRSPDSFTKLSDGMLPLSPESASVQRSPTVSPTSQSLGELRTSSSYVIIPRIKKSSRGLLDKLRGSTFSLNAAIYGYEPLEPVEHLKSNKKRLERSSSDRQPLSDGQLCSEPRMTPLGEFGNKTTGTGSGFLGDSGLLGDCGVALVDVASQTDDIDMSEYECTHKTCTLLMKNSSNSDSNSHTFKQLETSENKFDRAHSKC